MVRKKWVDSRGRIEPRNRCKQVTEFHVQMGGDFKSVRNQSPTRAWETRYPGKDKVGSHPSHQNQFQRSQTDQG